MKKTFILIIIILLSCQQKTSLYMGKSEKELTKNSNDHIPISFNTFIPDKKIYLFNLKNKKFYQNGFIDSGHRVLLIESIIHNNKKWHKIKAKCKNYSPLYYYIKEEDFKHFTKASKYFSNIKLKNKELFLFFKKNNKFKSKKKYRSADEKCSWDSESSFILDPIKFTLSLSYSYTFRKYYVTSINKISKNSYNIKFYDDNEFYQFNYNIKIIGIKIYVKDNIMEVAIEGFPDYYLKGEAKDQLNFKCVK